MAEGRPLPSVVGMPHPATPAPPFAARGARLRFLRAGLSTPRTTGAITHSGAALGRALVAPVVRRRGDGPLRVLEVGAGSGAVTAHLLRVLDRRDQLDVLEADPRWVPGLEAWLGGLPPGGPRVVVRQGAFPVPEPSEYDVVVSGIPLTNLEPAAARAVLQGFDDVLAPGGTLSFFLYVGTRTVRRIVSAGDAPRHAAVEEEVRRHVAGRASSVVVLANLPPARVWTVATPRPPEGSGR
ncbi:rRNA adenine N-6-methyltransferase family protein [Alteromonas gracilis]